jgi:hypothetical protein
MNLQLNYLYRDGSNYKQFGAVVFGNERDIEIDVIKNIITANLIDGEYFIAEEWGVPSLFFEDKNKDDHQWHEFESLEQTNTIESLTGIDALLRKILKANS